MAKLYFYYSAMNAGKSTVLLQAAYNYQERGMDCVLFTPAFDDRFESNTVTSRIGLQAPALAFTENTNLYQTLCQQINKNPNIQCLLIDEAQFLNKDQVRQCAEITFNLNIPVLCYGLRTDFRGEPFPGSLYLLAWAEELIELKTVCHCGAKATMNVRIDEMGNPVSQGNQVEIGGNDRYVAACHKHFREGVVKPLKKISEPAEVLSQED